MLQVLRISCALRPETTDFTKALCWKTKFLFLRCRSDSPLSFRLFFLFSLSLSLFACAAESGHQINTDRGIVFRLETAKQVTDNGNTWKCMNCGCKKAIPVQISVGTSLKSNLILEFNNSPKLFSRRQKKKKRSLFEMISIQAHAFLTYQRHTHTSGWGLIMKPSLGPPNVIIIIKTSTDWRRRGNLSVTFGLVVVPCLNLCRLINQQRSTSAFMSIFQRFSFRLNIVDWTVS